MAGPVPAPIEKETKAADKGPAGNETNKGAGPGKAALIDRTQGHDAQAASTEVGGSIDKGRTPGQPSPLVAKLAGPVARLTAQADYAVENLNKLAGSADVNEIEIYTGIALRATATARRDADAIDRLLRGVDVESAPAELRPLVKQYLDAGRKLAVGVGHAPLPKFGVILTWQLHAAGQLEAVKAKLGTIAEAASGVGALTGVKSGAQGLLARLGNVDPQKIAETQAAKRTPKSDAKAPADKASKTEVPAEVKAHVKAEAKPAASQDKSEPKADKSPESEQNHDVQGRTRRTEQIGEKFTVQAVVTSGSTVKFTLNYFKGDGNRTAIIAPRAKLDPASKNYEGQEIAAKALMYREIDKILGAGTYNPDAMGEAIDHALAEAGDALVRRSSSGPKARSHN